MTSLTPLLNLIPGSDCTDQFQCAYENRYTWGNEFSGYKGKCSYKGDGQLVEGKFLVGSDLKANVYDIKDESFHKLLTSQLWEVAIHRVRRAFKDTHGQNTFTSGDIDEVGLEVIVGGRNAGDKYRIKDNIVTMVHRNIHGKLINIFTIDTFNTGNGYLSKTYTSQYFDPSTLTAISAVSKFKDSFSFFDEAGFWVLSERVIEINSFEDTPRSVQTYKFWDMKTEL